MKSESWFCVIVRDRLTGSEVVVGDFLTRSEAMRISRVLKEFDACIVIVDGSQFKKGEEFE